MGRDIEQRITDYEQKYGYLTKGLVDAVWVVDVENMRYLYITPEINKLRGYTAEEIVDMPVHEHMTPDSYKKVSLALAQELETFQGGRSSNRIMELEFLRKDWSTVWLEVTARLYQEKNGSIRMIGISKDIDQRKKLELERENLIRRLEAADAENKKLLKENKILMGLLPICANCKKIRDEDGHWIGLEKYIASRTKTRFTHTICPDCAKNLYPELDNI